VNDVDLKQGATAQLDGETPAHVVITFPLPIDRASVERWLPRTGSTTWIDDQTVSLTISANENNLTFKVPESKSIDGSTIVDLFFVSLSVPPSVVVSTYSPDELLAGARPPRDSAFRVSAADERRFSPDGREVLLYQTTARPTGHAPRVFDLANRSTLALPVPAPARGPLLVAAWPRSDRIVLVGDGIWVGPPDGSAVRTVSDLRAFGKPVTAAVSALGNFVALGWSDRLMIVDLASGATRLISNHHDECGPETSWFTRLAWSRDERRIAVVECPAPATQTVRIVDLASDRTAATLEGGDMGVTTLLTGDFTVSRESGEHGEGQRRLIVVYSFAGAEKARYLGYAPTLSPDGRYMLDGTCCAGEGFVLTDLQASGQPMRAVGGIAMWLPEGRVIVLQGSAGAR
jgi:hypothetical protein